MAIMPYRWCWSLLQLTGHAEFWHPTPCSRVAAPANGGGQPVTGATANGQTGKGTFGPMRAGSAAGG